MKTQEQSKKNMYDVSSYSNEELYDLLDLVNPSDRVLEAKIIQMIQKYNNIHNKNGNELTEFFKDVYKHFFIIDEQIEEKNENNNNNKKENETEGFEVSKKPQVELMQQVQKRIKTTPGPDSTQTPSSITSVGYIKDYINPLLKQTIKRIISIDSQFRGSMYPMSTDFTFNLSEPLKDVVELSLSSIQLPYTWYTITNNYGANYFYLKGISDGINNGDFDYKIEVFSGNYTPDILINTINQSIQVLKQNNTDVYFGSTGLSYNASTNLTTINVEINNNFDESNFYLYFEVDPLIYVNNDIIINDYNRKNNDNNIGGYLGFNNQQYYFNTITSLKILPAPLTSPLYYLDSNDVFKYIDNNVSPKIITDGNYNNESNNQKYYIDNSNNYFHIILYEGPNEYSNASIIVQNVKIVLKYSFGSYTRQELLDEINYQLSVNFYLSDSVMKREYINDISMANFKYSYFRMTINWNKKKIPNKTNNLKTIVIFPYENNLFTTLWVKDSNNLLRSCCFNFDFYQNELNNLYSETTLLETNYLLNKNATIEIICIEPGYTNYENHYQIQIANSREEGYSLIEYIDAINLGIQTLNLSTISYNPPDGIFKNTFIENTDKVHIYFDIVKNFNNSFYNLNLNSENDSFINIDNVVLYDTDNETPLQIMYYNEIPCIDLSTNITLKFKWNTTNSFQITQSNFISIIPKQGGHNSHASTWNVTTNSLLKGTNNILITRIEDFVINIQNTLTKFQDIDNSFPLQNSSVSYKYYSSTETSLIYMITINLIITKFLTQNSYQVVFNENNITSETFVNSSWYKYLKIKDYSYNLSDYDVIEKSYSDISGTEEIQTNILNLNNVTTLQIIPYKNGVISQTNTNNIVITIPNGSYTKEQLFTLINNKLTENPITNGSYINSVIINEKKYTKIRMNMNKTFTANDYSLVFYDLYRFVKCYLGVKSVRNVTWDSTLGWILGYRNQTEYLLSMITPNNLVKSMTGDTTVTISLYNYFLIKLDDYTQSHMNDGVVTLSSTDNKIPLPSYALLDNFQCDPVTGQKIMTGISGSENDNTLTQNQLYSAQQILNSKTNIVQKFSKGLFTQDIFGLIPIKTSGMSNGSVYVEFGGTLQNQQRTYFGPVNISRLSIQLLNDRGDVVDLNGSNWSFSFICEQLYQQKSI